MKKVLLLSILILATLIHAKMYNGIAIVVNGEPITIAEVNAVQKQLRVSKKEAEDLLIKNRMERAATKGIAVSEDEIDKRISLIAQQNNISVKKMQAILKKQGQSWNKFRDQMKIAIQKQKFFRTKIAPTIPEPSEDELKIYYRNHAKLFSTPSSIEVIEYSASTPAKIQSLLHNPANTHGVKHHKKTFKGNDLTPQLLAMISQTPMGHFTPAFNTGNAYVTYKILNKGKGRARPFEEVKRNVAIAWKREHQADAVKDYFKKMRSNAMIQYIRR
jgi:parvulin-like peptidyl-prolyl isomerase